MANIIPYITFGIVAIIFTFSLISLFAWRWIVKKVVKGITKIIFTDSYQENLLEFCLSN